MKKLINADGSIFKLKTQKMAVALKYPEGADAPFITAKGKGELAEKIIEEAQKNNVRIEENTPLVKLLSTEDINSAVPEEAYEALAAIFAFVLSDNKR